MINSKMEEGKSHEVFQDSWFQYGDVMKKSNDEDEKCTSSSSTSSIGEDSDASNGSSICSLDTSDDVSSSSSANSNSSSSGALNDLSEIMEQLPIKRGLSKFYKGKSESFTSLARVTSIEDLAKQASPYRRNLKASKSFGNGLHGFKQYTHPRANISKKAAKGSFSSLFPSKKGSFMNCKSPLTPLYQNLEC